MHVLAAALSIFDVLQFGALGLLGLVLFFGGKLAKVFIDGTLANQGRQTEALNKLTERVEKLADAQESAQRSIQELRKENSKEHEGLIEGLRRLGGFKPSETTLPAVRAEVRQRPRYGSRPDER